MVVARQSKSVKNGTFVHFATNFFLLFNFFQSHYRLNYCIIGISFGFVVKLNLFHYKQFCREFKGSVATS